MQKNVCTNVLMASIIAAVLIGGTTSGYTGIASAETRNAAEIRLQRLEDREAIRELLMDYGRFLDQRDFASFSQLFAEKDGEWNGGMGTAKGPQAIRRLMEETCRQAKEMGCSVIIAETSGLPHYEPTRAFYISNGFDLEARLKDFYAMGDDKLFYTKRI